MPSVQKIHNIYASAFLQNSGSQSSQTRQDKHEKDAGNRGKYFKDILKDELAKKQK